MIDIPIVKKKKKTNGGVEWGYKGFFSSHTSNSRGIAILFNNTFPFTVHNEIYNKNGNYLILAVTIQECWMTLGALLWSKWRFTNFYTHLQEMISSLQNSSIIMVAYAHPPFEYLEHGAIHSTWSHENLERES